MSRSQPAGRDERVEARDVRERFLTAIAERIPLHRIAELHLFPAIRQGPLETGIAVVAVYPEENSPEQSSAHDNLGATDGAGETVERGGDGEGADRVAAPSAVGPEAGDEARAGEGAGVPPRHHDSDATSDSPHRSPASPVAGTRAEGAGERDRLTVYRATYRWVRKGPERGKWEVDVRAEADAPLETVEDIVRGVHRRAGGEAEPERLSGDAVRAAVAERPWATPV